MRKKIRVVIFGIGYLLLFLSDVCAQNKCSAPLNLKVKNVGGSFAKISWSKVDGSFGYKIRARVAGANEWSSMRVLPLDSSARISNLVPNADYEMQILSFCNLDLSDTSLYSDAIKFHTDFPCEAPANLKCDSVTATSVVLFWSGPLNGVKYVIRYKSNDEKMNWVATNVKGGFINSIKLTSLKPGTKYVWTVSCKCSGSGFDDSSFAEPLGSFITSAH